MRIAAADIGSNTVHVQVCDVMVERVADVGSHSLMPQLGPVVARTGEVGSAAPQVLADLRQVLDHAREQWGWDHLVAGATEAVRKAADRDAFLAAAGRLAGVPFRLISGEREAQLSFAGVALRHAARGEWLAADLGGGSLELMVAHDRALEEFRSLPIGSGVLADQFLSDPPSPGQRQALRRRALELLKDAPEVDPQRLVATGGTAAHLPLLVSSRRPPSLLSVDALLKAEEELDRHPAAEIAARLQLPEARVKALRGGVEVFLLLLDWAGLSQLQVSHEGLRHGMIVAYRDRGDDWWR